MANAFTRNLTFQSNDLGKDATLALTFDVDTNGMYDEFFPVVWKVFPFWKNGSYRSQATYTNQLAFFKPQVAWDNSIIDALACVELNVGEKTSLTEANDVYSFSRPVAGIKDVLQAVNNTEDVQDIAVGFMTRGDLKPKPSLYYPEVGDGSPIMAQFNTVLRAYITSNYQENAILREPIATFELWSHDLAALPENTTWNLKYDSSSGRYTIVQA
ncbi:hypothetical protein CY34DRAFT_807502 [Suillus luteus UH-Slu-Lm8-n1]|uniref:Uncharacterized protein n=1 Tax=Suillus luteus UH-Slu-Lm8-n1 TaxID=930992 RepID=A0A0C9ZQZ1_9AGAM|nr:hypothetical protein CY34DRAFT_807502 [Suillus luteus UH-Slu-Lm8-n1]